MQKYERAGSVRGKHAELFEIGCFALELKEIYILGGLTALPSALSDQHIPQLAHGNPDTAQIPNIRTYWTRIERAALSLAPKEAQRSERQQAWGTRLGAAATHPPKYVQMSTGSAAEKHRERANNAVLPVGAVLAAPWQLPAQSQEVGRRTRCVLLQMSEYSGSPQWLLFLNGHKPSAKMTFSCLFFPCKSQSEETNWERTTDKSM